MNEPTDTESIAVILATLAFIPSAVLTIPTLLPFMRGEGQVVARRATWAALASFLVSLILFATVLVVGPVSATLLDFGALDLRVGLDHFSTLILLMVSFLGLVITRYSINHMGGDPRQDAFTRRLLVTISMVLLLVVTSNLLLFTIAWGASSWSLHRLLVFYPERPGAKLAAKKKFIISRLGDLCLIGVLIMTWQHYGTWNFSELFDLAQASPAPSGIAFLLVIGAMMKSAQLPFHSWLPETMESPTPVSALMHAGIINAGGFLILRLSPLIVQSPLALDALALVGGATAILGSLVMITQPSIKRALAWSTISQMGFMMLQCGLGAFALAALHLVAHSFYKAHAFLSAGGIVARVAKRSNQPTAAPARIWAFAIVVATALTFAALAAKAGLGHVHASDWVLFSVLALALVQLITGTWSARLPKFGMLWGFGLAASVTVIVVLLHGAVESFFAGSFPEFAAIRSAFGWVLLVLVPVLLFGIILLQAQLGRGTESKSLRKLYLHAANGFYLGTLFARLIGVRGGVRSK